MLEEIKVDIALTKSSPNCKYVNLGIKHSF